jgi:hypothetical protein
MVIVAVVLLLLGPDKLPEVAHKLGASWRAIKRIQERVEEEVREVIPDLPSAGDIARVVRSPVNLLNELANRADLRDGLTTAADVTPTDVTEPIDGPPQPRATRTSPPSPLTTPVSSRPAPTPDDSSPIDPSLN